MKGFEAANMILILEPGLPPTRRNQVRALLEERGVTVRHVEGGGRSYLEVYGDDLPVRTLTPESWPGVERVVELTSDHPHASWGGGRGDLLTPTLVNVGATTIGQGGFTVIAGPCAVEERERTLSLAERVRDAGADMFRAGAFKPRTSPYAFQGLEEQGLEILAEVRQRTGLPVVTELMESADIERVVEVADVIQVGSRNMQNYALLKRLAQVRKPILLKRGYAATLRELLLAAEYLLAGGNDRVILCERGIRSAAGEQSVILDLGAIPELRRRTHLPIIVDPSHGSASAHRVRPLARAAAAVGADGLLVEVHDAPERALSDGRQALGLDELRRLVMEVTALRKALEGELATPPAGASRTAAGKGRST